MIDQEFEEKINCLAEEYGIDPKQASLFKKVIRYLLKDVENRVFRDVLANPERLLGLGDFEKTLNEWVWKSFVSSKLEIIQNLPNRSQVIEFLEFDYKASPDDETEIEEFLRGFINRSIQNDETENEKFLRRFLNKSIKLAKDHWKNFGNFEIGTPETSAFKKYESLIRGYLLKLGVFTPDPFRQYMSGYMNRYEQQKAEAFRTMDKNPSFQWNDFADLFGSMPLDLVAAIFTAEIDPDVWTRRVEAIARQKSKEGGKKGRKKRSQKKEDKIEVIKRCFESFQKEHPGKSYEFIRNLCEEQLAGKGDHKMPESTFSRLMRETAKRFNYK